ncbi:hypothetical protein LTR33_003904 [Friedmanniomyces endolithicus]|nr:hypothetical protein LTR33_003904 [Friedmanniomyces endolithicus]
MRLLKMPLCRPAQLRVALGARRPYVTGNSASSVDSPEPLRACGVPDTATEAGPKEPSEILFPLMCVGAGGGLIMVSALYYLAPWSTSTSGSAIGQKMRDGRKAVERREGDLEMEETSMQRNEEVKYAAQLAKRGGSKK